MPVPPVGQPLGSPFIQLHTVDSTNNYALAQIHANLAQPGSCYFAHDQTAGRGQRGKSWATEKRTNITISLVLKPAPLPLFQQFHLSACVAVGTHHFLTRYIGSSTTIKWPNDLYWQDKKLAGILIENIVKNNEHSAPGWEWAVVGIGINVNQTKFPDGLKNPVSLKIITGLSFDTIQLAKELCQSVDFYYRKLVNEGIAPILQRYNAVLYKKDEAVKFKKLNRIFEATVKKVSESGQLVVQHSLEERFDFGEVDWII